MAIYHCAIKVISRGKNKSAVASSAYRSGTKMTNEYDGVVHDFTRKQGIHSCTLLLPDHAPKEYQNRSVLWNAVEQVEKAKNSQLAREVEVSIPKEIPQALWQKMMVEYCNQNFVSKGMIADVCIHNKDPNNPHCHILLTVRPLAKDGTWGAKCRKEYVLDEHGQRIPLPSGKWKSTRVNTTEWNEQSNAELWRANWGEHCNAYLEKAGHAQRIDHRSYKRQGVDQFPTIHVGVQASQMEQKGMATDRGNLNRQITADNKEIKITRARVTRLMKWQRELEAQPLDLASAEVKPSVVAKLHAPKTQASTRYQSVKDLRLSAELWNFVQTHGIETWQDFASTISDLNASFYAIQRERKSIQKQHASMEERITLWDEQQKLKPHIAKYNQLSDKDKQAFAMKHPSVLRRYKELQAVWKKIQSTEGKLTPKQWQKTRTNLEHDLTLCDWKLKALKQEIGTAEKMQKLLMQQKDEVAKQPPIKQHDEKNLL